MYNVDFNFKQGDIVGVDFEELGKHIGIVETFRFTHESCKPLYKVSGINMYIPETMLIELKEEQKQAYFDNQDIFYKIKDITNDYGLMVGNLVLNNDENIKNFLEAIKQCFKNK